ncbi:ABC transporter ATP-binding protein [Sphingosinicella terrae]|uniref:ABC transporter ATP-binding protein n=1 Tax=Sphingosinicella terrae TaxID=2172047 RepID=UPI000E0CE880|nr:oligopeptide/dipeptide ABC transporter ATP-binding protein [Sphingosinicella terrae]
MTLPVLEVSGLAKHYPVGSPWFHRGERSVVRAVDGISFSIAEGETFGLIGESGCGKTTTVKMLLGLEPSTAGRILFQGEEVQNADAATLRQYRAQIQTVFQDPYSSLSPRMRVEEIIAEPLITDGRLSAADRRDRVAELLEVVGLPKEAATRFPHEFSGGQRQRIAIARSLSQRPRLLILDEPVSALDVSIRAQVLNLLRDLQQRLGLSYLLISHDFDVVAHMCRRIAVMYLGRIVETGPTKIVRDRPSHPYSKALFSAVLAPDPDAVHRHIRLPGVPPSPIDPPSGCRFRTRCPLAQPLCAEVEPQLLAGAGGALAACHFTERIDSM